MVKEKKSTADWFNQMEEYMRKKNFPMENTVHLTIRSAADVSSYERKCMPDFLMRKEERKK